MGTSPHMLARPGMGRVQRTRTSSPGTVLGMGSCSSSQGPAFHFPPTLPLACQGHLDESPRAAEVALKSPSIREDVGELESVGLRDSRKATRDSGTQFLLRGQDLRGFPVLRISCHLADTEPPAFITSTHRAASCCQGGDVLMRCFSKNRDKSRWCLFKAVEFAENFPHLLSHWFSQQPCKVSFHSWGERGPERLNNRFKVTELGSD